MAARVVGGMKIGFVNVCEGILFGTCMGPALVMIFIIGGEC